MNTRKIGMVNIVIWVSLQWTNIVFAQDYHPIPEENVYWVVEHYDTSLPCGYSELYYYYLNGDTVFQGKTYKKLYKKILELSCNVVTYPLDFIGGIRQDTITRKIYCSLNYLGNQDTLLYDFALSLGDTLNMPLLDMSGTPQIVDRIDSVQLLDSSYRRTFHFAPGVSGSDSLIEGVGSRFGLLEPFDYGISDFKILRCFKANSILLLGSGTQCTIINDVNNSLSNFNIQLYPNPTSDDVFINSINGILGFTLYSLEGRVCLKRVLNYETEFGIDLKNLYQGVYFIELFLNNGVVTKKIVVNSEN